MQELGVRKNSTYILDISSLSMTKEWEQLKIWKYLGETIIM